ncbi:MAG: alanine racemase, partial [Chloroflexota bacterium]
LQLRRGGIDAPILVIGPPNLAQVELALQQSIQLTVSTEDSLAAVVNTTDRIGTPATIHVKVDTGLHRYGAMPALAVDLVRRLHETPGVTVEGIYTHFSSSDEENPEPTLAQIRVMRSVIQQLKSEEILPSLVHVANSAAILTKHYSETNMVRAGIATYGLDPSSEVPVEEGFRQILELKSVLSRQFILEAGESVSYNRAYTAEEDHPAGTVPIGYADGIERHLSNAGWFVVGGTRSRILGRVCMDQTVIRVPEEAMEGDEVTIIGSRESGAMTVADVGALCQTNTYEPVVRLAARVPRIFIRDGAPSSWSLPLLGERGTF